MTSEHGVSNSTTDECYTPDYAVIPLLKYLPTKKRIWCPFDKHWSAFVRILENAGHTIVCSHIDNGGDFFEYEPEDYDIIISNPPFSLADPILKRLYEFGKPFIMLLPLKYLQSKVRAEMFIKYGIQLLSFDKRIGYYADGDMTKVKEGNNQASAYFCRDALPQDLIIEVLDKKLSYLGTNKSTEDKK